MKRILLITLLMLSFLFPVFAYADEGQDVANEQESMAEEKANEAIKSINQKKDKAADRYDQLMDDIENGRLGTKYDKDWKRNVVIKYYKAYQTFKYVAPYICVGSVFLGILGAFISKYNKKARKKFIVIFIFVIPVLVVAAVFGIGILNSSI